MLVPCDSTGVFLVRLFHVYQRNYAKTGTFAKVSLRETRPFNRLAKKKKMKSFVVRTVYKLKLRDSSEYSYNINNCILLRKRLYPRGRVLLGPMSFTIRRKKLHKSFVKIL